MSVGAAVDERFKGQGIPELLNLPFTQFWIRSRFNVNIKSDGPLRLSALTENSCEDAGLNASSTSSSLNL